MRAPWGKGGLGFTEACLAHHRLCPLPTSPECRGQAQLGRVASGWNRKGHFQVVGLPDFHPLGSATWCERDEAREPRPGAADALVPKV